MKEMLDKRNKCINDHFGFNVKEKVFDLMYDGDFESCDALMKQIMGYIKK